MAQQQQHAPGGHYSGHNPIPTVRQFIDNLDKDKKERDAKIDQAQGANLTNNNAKAHQPREKTITGTEKTVTDPTTGREVTIADVNKDMVDEVENPTLVVPNANLQKDTVCISRQMWETFN